MKHNLLRAMVCMATIFLTMTAFAQDVIKTTKDQEIKAKIIEVSKSEVRYKDFDNQDGPTFVLETKEISSITYASGKEVVYTHDEASASSNDVASGRILRDNGQYLHNNTYISAKEVERILEREDQAAYSEWRKAKGLYIGGSVCVGVGAGLAIGGLICLAFKDYYACIGMDCAALVPLGVGLGLAFGSSSHYNKAIDLYNSKFDKVAVQLRWGVSSNGLGLALAF